jgi:hypothetical protein
MAFDFSTVDGLNPQQAHAMLAAENWAISDKWEENHG